MLKLATPLFAFLTAFIGVSTHTFDEDPIFDESRTLIATGKLDEAKASITKGLSVSPYSTEGYQLMYDIAKKQSSSKEQLRWGKWMAWSLSATNNKKELESLQEELATIYENWNADDLILDEWKSDATKAATKAASSKQFRLAGH